MDVWIAQLQLQTWKPIVTALVLPPVPFLLLMLIALRTAAARRGLAWALGLVAVASLWLSSTMGLGEALTDGVLRPPPALSISRIAELKARVAAHQPVAIVVLGGGREPLAPEYASGDLAPNSAERLRYGLWLARETGAPVAFSGGVGWEQDAAGDAEADIAARIAQRDYRQPLRWTETASRDTRENAERTLPMLRAAGIREVVLVTHGWHMPRALRLFRGAADGVSITAAPMGVSRREVGSALRWLPSSEGYSRVRLVLRELLGLLAAP